MNTLLFVIIMLCCIAVLFAVLWNAQAQAIKIEREYAAMCDRAGMDRFKQWVRKQRRV